MYHEVALPDGRRGYVIYTAGSFQRREVTQLGVITAHKRPFMTGKHQIREASAYAACLPPWSGFRDGDHEPLPARHALGLGAQASRVRSRQARAGEEDPPHTSQARRFRRCDSLPAILRRGETRQPRSWTEAGRDSRGPRLRAPEPERVERQLPQLRLQAAMVQAARARSRGRCYSRAVVETSARSLRTTDSGCSSTRSSPT